MYQLVNKFEEALTFIFKNIGAFLDKPFIYEKIAFLSLKLGKNDQATEYILKALERNPENIIYYLHYFNANGIKEDLANLHDLNKITDRTLAIKLLYVIREKKIKSRLSDKIELVLASGDAFKQKISAYITQSIKQNIPSILNAIKSIYDHQKDKINVIGEIILAHINSIETKSCLAVEYTNNEKLDLMTHFSWVYYFAGLHFDNLRELEKAMDYINKAIDITPSVTEFYGIKSKILKHAGMLKESSEAFEKVIKIFLTNFNIVQKIRCRRSLSKRQSGQSPPS